MIIDRTKQYVALGCLTIGLVSGFTGTASADAPAKARAGVPAAKSAPEVYPVTRLSERLKSADADEVRAALIEVKEAGKRAAPAAPAVADLLRRGTTPSLAALALGALALIGSPAQGGVVAAYAHHRVADLRSKAVVALGTCGGEAAVPTLRQALGDLEPAVRGSAASALGAVGSGARVALTDLYASLDRNVLEAAAAIGQLCVGDECAAFSAKTGRIGLDVMISGFDALLFRASNEVPDAQKIKVIERVRDLRTIEANKYLRDLQSRSAALSPQVKQSIDQAVLATAGAAS